MKKSRLDAHCEEIVNKLAMGITKTRVAKDYGVNPATLHHWLNTRGVRSLSKTHPLKDKCITLIEDTIASVTNAIYRNCAREIAEMESSGEWLGNSHHAAQKITAKAMDVLEPALANAIRKEVLR